MSCGACERAAVDVSETKASGDIVYENPRVRYQIPVSPSTETGPGRPVRGSRGGCMLLPTPPGGGLGPGDVEGRGAPCPHGPGGQRRRRQRPVAAVVVERRRQELGAV